MKNLSDMLAESMHDIITSDEHKELFSSAATIEKLAFHRVSDENNIASANELLEGTEAALRNKRAAGKCKECSDEHKKSGKCKCDCKEEDGCSTDCKCHKEEEKEKKEAAATVAQMKLAYKHLVEASEALENCGFEKLAIYSLQIVDRLVSEAKAKKDPKKAKEMKEKMEAMKKVKKEKEEAAKAKKKEKDENAARDAKAKKEKMKAKMEAEKAKAKEKAEKEKAKAKAAKEKAMKDAKK